MPGWLVARAVVEADRLVGREQVVGPAVRDQQRRGRRRVVDVVRGVVLGDLVDDVLRQRVLVVGLAGVDRRVPGRQVGVGVGAGRRVVAERLAESRTGRRRTTASSRRSGRAAGRARRRRSRACARSAAASRRGRSTGCRAAPPRSASPCRRRSPTGSSVPSPAWIILRFLSAAERHRDAAAVGAAGRRRSSAGRSGPRRRSRRSAARSASASKISCASRTSKRVSIRWL